MNKVILIGNLCSDPTANTTSNGKSVSNFRIAVQRRFANAQGVREADFFKVVAWGQTADFVNSYMIKGRKVAVEGRVENRSYTAQDGSTRWVTEIIADSVEALGGRNEGEARPADEAPPATDDFVEVDVGDELPFPV